jgi:hypothetical protein
MRLYLLVNNLADNSQYGSTMLVAASNEEKARRISEVAAIEKNLQVNGWRSKKHTNCKHIGFAKRGEPSGVIEFFRS